MVKCTSDPENKYTIQILITTVRGMTVLIKHLTMNSIESNGYFIESKPTAKYTTFRVLFKKFCTNDNENENRAHVINWPVAPFNCLIFDVTLFLHFHNAYICAFTIFCGFFQQLESMPTNTSVVKMKTTLLFFSRLLLSSHCTVFNL